MASRIDIELTSARADGTWTWRAAGARQPRGTVDGSLLPEGAKTGDVLRAEADFEIDGITITSLQSPKEKRRDEDQRIDIIGRPSGPPVTTELTSRRDGRRDGRPRREGEGSRRPGGEYGRRAPREGGLPAGRGGRFRPPAEAGAGPGSGDRPPRRRPPGPGRRSEGRGGQDEGSAREAEPAPREATTARRGRPGRPGDEARPGGRPRPVAAGAPERADARGRRRLNPANTHRAAVLASLPPEQMPVAEQVLRGGIPAVRTAIHLEREKAAAEGRPAPNADALLAMAEDLLPKLKAAEWRDRADAAARAGDDISLRDLRSVVAGADVARDEETRALAATLRETLERRVTAMRDQWSAEVAHHLDEGRVVRALRLASRPPDPQTRLSAELANRLSAGAGDAMTAETPPDRWVALLEAVAASPVRRNVHPAALPAQAGADVLRAAHQLAGRVPALASMLGIAIPPPPGPPRSGGRPPAPGRPVPAAAHGNGNGNAPRPAPAGESPAGESPAGESPAGESPAPPAVGRRPDPPPADPTAAVAEPPAPSTTEPAATEPAATEPAATEAGTAVGPEPAATGPAGAEGAAAPPEAAAAEQVAPELEPGPDAPARVDRQG